MLFHSWNNWWWWCHWCSCLSSMHGNKIQYRQFQPQNENCERYFYTISGVFYSSLQVLLSESKEKKVLSLFAYKMVWSGIVLDLLKDQVVVNFPAEVFSFWVTKFFFTWGKNPMLKSCGSLVISRDWKLSIWLLTLDVRGWPVQYSSQSQDLINQEEVD